MRRERLRKAFESVATFGLLLIAVGLVAPFAGLYTSAWLTAFKWIYVCGAAFYLGARLAVSFWRDESFRVRRLRRMESWAGICFAVGAFFWFWNTRSFSGMPTFHMLQETIVFTLAGAIIQLIASWMLSSALRKEQAAKNDDNASDKGNKQQ